ncbi:TadE/TadG family type IV pilus assembly protein [Microbacterium thalli]|uniref:TadE/TadG family type IV pilus assembly protein n=1 Tax=Microbacterium thalli TaxID=3027921 RepID=UPI002366B718|nr:TadE/TadG family type IV pilus assembly protein [Microbacterium thalli]MDD7929877.1 TadE/TadG family type IV pilus assembly protein [Microbacterium thalli]
MRLAADERGSAAAEFVMVGALLTLLTLGVLQVALAVYVRAVAHDAALDGAYHAALADVPDDAGGDRAREVVARTVGADLVQGADVRRTSSHGYPAIEVSLRVTVPLVGLLGVPGGWEVTAHAPADDPV